MGKIKTEPKVVHATCVVERSFSKSADVVFAALSEPSKIRQWMGGDDHSELIAFTCDFREGGRQVIQYKMRPDTPIAGATLTNEARFQQIVPNERIVAVSTMKIGDHMFSGSQITFELMPTEEGTDLILTHQGAFFEGADGPAMREEGWNVLMNRLVNIVHER